MNQAQALMGEGDLPVAGIARRLRDDGFDGYMSLEWRERHPELADPAGCIPSIH